MVGALKETGSNEFSGTEWFFSVEGFRTIRYRIREERGSRRYDVHIQPWFGGEWTQIAHTDQMIKARCAIEAHAGHWMSLRQTGRAG